MKTYALFPGLKKVLEDKRIRHWGISGAKDLYQDYLMAEQFVLDMRNMSADDNLSVIETYKDLQEIKLDKLPYENIVVHAFESFGKDMNWIDIPKYDGIVTVFYHKNKVFMLFEDPKALIQAVELTTSDPEAKKEFDGIVKLIKIKLIVMLATKNIIKEYHEARKNPYRLTGEPHKRGSGGYTIIRPPEAYEIEGGTHASPRPHLRRGHIRKLHPEDKTQWIWVSPCFVNGAPTEQRISYLTNSDAEKTL